MNTILKRLLGIAIVPAIFLSFTGMADRVNFSGEWKLDEGKSDLGQFANYAPRIIKITQTADSVMISKTAPSFSGENVTNSETLAYDGKETKTTFAGGTSTRTASAKWSDDGQALTITYVLMLDFNGQTTEIKGTEVWTLADGGTTLVSKNNSSSSFGDITSKGIYKK